MIFGNRSTCPHCTQTIDIGAKFSQPTVDCPACGRGFAAGSTRRVRTALLLTGFIGGVLLWLGLTFWQESEPVKQLFPAWFPAAAGAAFLLFFRAIAKTLCRIVSDVRMV